MNVFIDTNVFLTFYHFSSDDLEELRKLSTLIRQKKVNLFLPEQVNNEFRRNRSAKISDALDRLRKQNLSLQFPQLSKDYPEYRKLRDAQHKYNKLHGQLIEKIEQDVVAHSLKADTILEQLFDSSHHIDIDARMIEKAHLRMDLGNPPGKKGSYGDAIIWEALLDQAPELQPFYFISDDRDYFDPLDDSSLDEFLAREWKSLKQLDIQVYRRISQFFQDHFPDIKLAIELEKEVLIRRLAESGNFARTHQTIAALSKFSDFTSAQANEIVSAAINNTQISWIITDAAIDQFLNKLLKRNEHQVDPSLIIKLSELRYEDGYDEYEELPF